MPIRLYCPNCRQIYEEQEDRFAANGGSLPCRVCRTVLTVQEAPESFNPDMRTEAMMVPPAAMGPENVEERTQAFSLPAQLPGGAIGPGVGPGSGPPAGSVPQAGPVGGEAGNTPYSPQQPPQQQQPQWNAQQPQGNPPQQLPVGNVPRPGGQVDANTFIFPTDHPDYTGMSDPATLGEPPAMPGVEPSQQRTGPIAPRQQGDRPAGRRKLVLGGAAADSAEAMTAIYDVSVLGAPDGSMGQEPAPQRTPGVMTPSGQVQIGEASALGIRQTQQKPNVVSGAEVAGNVGLEPKRKGRGVLFFLLLLGAGAMFGIWFFLWGSPTEEPLDAEQVAAAALMNGPSVDHLLRSIQGQLTPVRVSGGETASEQGVAVGVSAGLSGQLEYWVARPDSPEPVLIDGEIATAVSGTGLPLFVMFDETVDTGAVLAAVEALRQADSEPWLTSESVRGESYLSFPVGGALEWEIRLQLTSSSIQLTTSDQTEPQVLCYSILAPADELTFLMDDALVGRDGTVSVQLDLDPNIPLSTTFSLVQAVYRGGIRFHLTPLEDTAIPSECSR